MKYSIPKLHKSNRIFFGMITLSIITVTTDLVISNTAVFGQQFLISKSGFLTYFAIVLAFWISQTIFYYFIRNRLKVMRFKGTKLVFTSRLLEASLWLLLILNFFTIIEMLSFGHYSVYLLIIIIMISYSLNILFMSLLSFMLVSWSKVSTNKVLRSYYLAAILAAISGVITIVYMTNIILDGSSEISSSSDILYPVYAISSKMGILNIANIISFLSSFIFMWIGSAIILRHYTLKISKGRYTLLIAAPLVYYIGQYFIVLNILFPFIDSSSTSFIYYYTVFFTFSSVVGSIIFAISFWLIARDLSRNMEISTYLKMCGFGFIMFFISASATVIHTPYPPFGIIAISIVGFSSYYILYGIYSSSVSLSEDINLRTLIRKSAISEIRFITSMSRGYLQDRVVNQVYYTTQKFEKNITEQTGISPSLSKDEIKLLIKQILDELRTNNGTLK
ncbi:MAG TPA: hypothetical protein VJ772_01015 [Nitrososphaeraceae archaeon]|nr:hypothetical protein [Nitrososphaeraceae archaeon]